MCGLTLGQAGCALASAGTKVGGSMDCEGQCQLELRGGCGQLWSGASSPGGSQSPLPEPCSWGWCLVPLQPGAPSTRQSSGQRLGGVPGPGGERPGILLQRPAGRPAPMQMPGWLLFPWARGISRQAPPALRFPSLAFLEIFACVCPVCGVGVAAPACFAAWRGEGSRQPPSGGGGSCGPGCAALPGDLWSPGRGHVLVGGDPGWPRGLS